MPSALDRMSDSDNARARQMALNALPPPGLHDLAAIGYRSAGHLLIVGPEDLACLAAAQVRGMASISILARGTVTNYDETHLARALAAAPDVQRHYAPLLALTGWLGAFTLSVKGPDGSPINAAQALIGQDAFDLVLDLCEAALIEHELPPPGYVRVAPGAQHLADALDALAGLVGEFEKPRYVEVNSSLCAHANRGMIGCTRCLDVCPADAIHNRDRNRDNDPFITVEANLCHGAGSCTTACPTGALSFGAPRPAVELERLRSMLDVYRRAGGVAPAVLICARAAAPSLSALPANVLPVLVEEAGAIGVELWLALLVDGARFVAIQVDADTPPTLRAMLQRETASAGRLLEALGHPAARVSLIEGPDVSAALTALGRLPAAPAVEEVDEPIVHAGKRGTLNQALDRLYAQGLSAEETIPLPLGSPYGRVIVDQDACTLCMSCVVLCPTRALHSAGDVRPTLAFVEADCVQCGLCAGGCPERAMTLEPRFVPASGMRREARVLNEEAPFLCISCAKPFATHSTIRHIIKKLEGHSHYQGDAAKRLKMCEDCRVKDRYRALLADPAAQLRL